MGEILGNTSIAPSLKAYLMRIDEQPMDRAYITWYPELVRARDRLMSSVNGLYRPELLKCFDSLETYGPRNSPNDGIEDRLLKAVLLELITVDDTSESHELILNHYNLATTAKR